MKTITLILIPFISIFFIPEKKSSSPCEFLRSDIKGHKTALTEYLNCLIKENLITKNRDDLLNEIRGKGISGKWINSPKIFATRYIQYKSLLKLSTKEDLLKMLDSKYPEERYYGFLGLAEQQDGDVFKELRKMIKDTAIVRGKFGCVVKEKTVADFCIDEVTKTYWDGFENFETEFYQLSIREKNKLDKLVLKSDVELEYKRTLAEERTPINIEKK